MVQVQPPLEFIPSQLNPLVLRLVTLLLPAWLRSRSAITEVRAANVVELAKLYQQFQAGKSRFLLAFRHPTTDDQLCMAYLLHHILPQVARQQGISLRYPTHSHFIYDRGIPLWAGAQIGWLYSRLGGTSIHRGKLDRTGLRAARDLFANSNFPIAAAPEGATNSHSEIVSPLEPGVAQLGFWCVEDLVKAGRSEQVFIVPIGIQYHYVDPPWECIAKLVAELEADSGLAVAQVESPPSAANLYHRLYHLGEHLLSLMEEFYTRFYHQALSNSRKNSANATTSSELEISDAQRQEFAARLQALSDAALKVAEQYFNLQAKGSAIDRCRRLEQAAWDYIYREDIKDIAALSPVERGLANRIATEADLSIWHMRLVENLAAVTGGYVRSNPTAERFAETTLLIWEAIARIKGANSFQRPRLGKQWVQMTVGEPISVSDRWSTYQADRRSAKQATTNLTQDLQIALEQMIS